MQPASSYIMHDLLQTMRLCMSHVVLACASMCACVCNQAPAAWSDLNMMVHHRMYPDGRHLQGHMHCGPNGFLEVVIEGETITTDVPNLMMQIHSRPLLKRPAAAESIGSPKKVKLKPAAAEGAPDIIVHRKPAAEAAPAKKAAQAAEAEAAPAQEGCLLTRGLLCYTFKVML